MAAVTSQKSLSSLHVEPERVLVVESADQWEQLLDLFMHHVNQSKVLGFDCEWVTVQNKKSANPVSMLQLATLTGMCVLIRLHLFSRIPSSLAKLLGDKSILKVGVACTEDAFRLERDHGLCTNGCVDLRHLALRCGFDNSMGFGLKALAALVLNVDLDKRPSIRASNWEEETLSKLQVVYAAKDAVVGAFIFWRLIAIKSNSDSYFYPVNKDFQNKLLSFCQGIVDLNYKAPKDKGSSANGFKAVNIKEHRNRAYVVRQTPLYHNCQMIAPDGQLLCTCDVRKASWYIEKGLAVKLSDNPLRLQLTFEPSGRPIDEQNYYTQDKLNICVVCGAEDTYIRKSIIPHEYRKYFPPVMKEHRSHDILLMCLRCHQKSNIYDQILKKELAVKCNAPLDTDKKFHNDDNIMQVKSAARALDNQNKKKCKIPEARLDELRQIIRTFYGVNDIGPEIIRSAKDLSFKVRSETYIPHGDKVVEYISQHDGGLIEFERMWRQKFLDNMQPHYLPPMWSVDHHHYQLTSMEYKMKVTSQSESESKDGKFLKS